MLEWAIAMSGLNLPPYVLEHIFNSLKLNQTYRDYQKRIAMDFIAIPAVKNTFSKVNENYVHLIVEERTHRENIQLFIAIQKKRNEK